MTDACSLVQDEAEKASSSAGPEAAGGTGEKAEPVKGQMTAIVTGALSVVFGVRRRPRVACTPTADVSS